MGKPREGRVMCDCGKLLAREIDGKIYVWCKHCKREVEIKIIRYDNKISNNKEPLSR